MTKLAELEPTRGLTRIRVEGFKSIHEMQTLDLAPVTVLAGPNSAGKSSMMQPLLLLKQTLEAPFDPGALLLTGENVKFTSADQMLFRCPGEECHREFAIELGARRFSWLRLAYICPPGEGVLLAEMRFREDAEGPEHCLRPDMSSDETRAALPKHVVSVFEKFFKRKVGKSNKPLRWGVAPKRFYLAVTLENNRSSLAGLGGDLDVLSLAESFFRDIAGILHLPGLRGNPARSYPTTAVESDYPGTFERYVASVINHWQRTGDPRIADVGADLKTLGLTWKVEARKIDDTQVELRVGRLPGPREDDAQDMVNIADVGFGVSQTLPVLVALRTAAPGRIVYLEQPEIHLHPNAQSALAQVIAEAAKRGVIVVLETHSAILLRSIQTLVALGDLDPQEVNLNWFTRDPLTGATRITRATPDAHGAYGNWPEDFDDVALRVERDYLDAIEKRLSA